MAIKAALIKKDSIEFLRDLSKNNNREWFARHKHRYADAQSNIVAFADVLLAEMNKHDKIENTSGKDCVFRIYRDVRFAKDKTPYNNYWSGFFKRATKQLRGGYYFHIEPGNSYLASGFWGPEPNDMKRIRQDIDLNYEDWGKMLSNKVLVKTFGKMTGEQLISAPRGYTKDHPAIELLRYKQFLLKYPVAGDDVFHPSFLVKVNDVFKKMRPFLDFMSEVLTTDANGVPYSD